MRFANVEFNTCSGVPHAGVAATCAWSEQTCQRTMSRSDAVADSSDNGGHSEFGTIAIPTPPGSWGESLPMIGHLRGRSEMETTARGAHLAKDSVQDSTIRAPDSIAADLLIEIGSMEPDATDRPGRRQDRAGTMRPSVSPGGIAGRPSRRSPSGPDRACRQPGAIFRDRGLAGDWWGCAHGGGAWRKRNGEGRIDEGDRGERKAECDADESVDEVRDEPGRSGRLGRLSATRGKGGMDPGS